MMLVSATMNHTVATATVGRHPAHNAAAKPCVMVRGNGRQIDPGTSRRFMG
jgi:hypothetical protein